MKGGFIQKVQDWKNKLRSYEREKIIENLSFELSYLKTRLNGDK
jgi:uncharacterized protein (UPF0297 family)